jgi:iron complex outermembrane receptor protein
LSSKNNQALKLRRAIAALCIAGAALQTHQVRAADAAADAETGTSLDEVIVTGSRQTGIKASDSAAPIQIISTEALKNSGAPDLMTALAQVVPSLQLQAFGFDMAGQTLQTRLRGVSPNDVLVLVNGKRRHNTANLAVDTGSPYQGGAAPDLNFIPLDAVDHIEVLTDGAAAQYGTDAIAGVVNIILKKNNSGGLVQGTYGQYGNSGGRTEDVSGNAGFGAGEGGFFSLTGEYRSHGHSNVGEPDPRGPQATTYPNTNIQNVPGYPYENMISGDGAQRLKIFSINSGYDFDNGMELYAFGTYGHKDAASYENYRVPSKVAYTDPATGVTTYPFPYGFNPQEASDEDDYQINIGLKGSLLGWDWDFGTGYRFLQRRCLQHDRRAYADQFL